MKGKIFVSILSHSSQERGNVVAAAVVVRKLPLGTLSAVRELRTTDSVSRMQGKVQAAFFHTNCLAVMTNIPSSEVI